MDARISASVGAKGGRNLPVDVMTVQMLLNQVPLVQGRPMPVLQVDGVCGFRTISAIQKFQLKQFGWQGCDGRVDPGGITLKKLNELTKDARPAPEPLRRGAILICPHSGSVSVQQAHGGAPVLSADDRFIVSGCPFVMPGPSGGIPSPCVEVKWDTSSGTALNERSTGICFSAAKAPQGPVLVLGNPP